MSTEHQTTRLPARVSPLSALPQPLFVAMQARISPASSGHYVPPAPPSPALIAMAKSAIPAMIETLRPVPPDQLKAWLRELANALPIAGAATDEDRVSNAFRAVTRACGKMVAECFTGGTLGDVLRHPDCRFFPAPATLYAILLPVEERAKARVRALREIADYRVPERESPPITAEERAQVAERMRAFAAEMKAKSLQKEEDGIKIAPAHASKLQLAMAARRDGMPIERLRPDLRAALQAYQQESDGEAASR